mmetsp:Transcript_21722/g.60463  ORF Transcript_21722/g.60463 Transcript_21722/m.60463 type:complete len:206 (-) Transcript_21722:86-703(-)
MKLSFFSAITATLMRMFSTTNNDILLQSFAGESGWVFQSDDILPHGFSTGTLTAAMDRSFFNGSVKYQQFIDAMGFVRIIGTKSFPDISTCEAIEITVKSLTGYQGYYIAFGDTVPAAASAIPFEWRTDIPLQASGTNGTTIPFAAFSSSWNFGTGRIDVPCLANPAFCPPSSVLRNIKFMEIWAQGVAGQFDTDLFTIKGVGGC